jgi:hypothetical protein
MSVSLAQPVMASWPVTVAIEERVEEENKRNALTNRPGACLDGMAGQCPRGRPGATWEGLHRAAPGAPHLGCFHRCCTLATTTSEMHSEHREKNHRRIELGGDRIRRSLSQEWQGISSEVWRPPNPSGGGGRGHWGAPFALGDGGWSRRSWPESSGDGGGDSGSGERVREERGSRANCLGRFDRPSRSARVLVRPEWAGLNPLCFGPNSVLNFKFNSKFRIKSNFKLKQSQNYLIYKSELNLFF